MCGGLLCGGQLPLQETERYYCLKWDPESGTFSETPVERNIRQQGLSCWDLGDRGVLIMGYNGDGRTTDLVDVNGLASSSSFGLKHKIM